MLKEINKICFTQELSRPYYVRNKNNSPLPSSLPPPWLPEIQKHQVMMNWCKAELQASTTNGSTLTVGCPKINPSFFLFFFFFQFLKLIFNEITGNRWVLDSIHQAEMPQKRHHKRSSVFFHSHSFPTKRLLAKNVEVSRTPLITIARPHSALLLHEESHEVTSEPWIGCMQLLPSP